MEKYFSQADFIDTTSNWSYGTGLHLSYLPAGTWSVRITLLQGVVNLLGTPENGDYLGSRGSRLLSSPAKH
jgi:hypothetical protein